MLNYARVDITGMLGQGESCIANTATSKAERRVADATMVHPTHVGLLTPEEEEEDFAVLFSRVVTLL
jgi:hypothetical protein